MQFLGEDSGRWDEPWSHGPAFLASTAISIWLPVRNDVGLPMVYQCFTHGLPMIYPWFTHGFPIYPCFTHGLPMFTTEIEHDHSMLRELRPPRPRMSTEKPNFSAQQNTISQKSL